MKGSSTAIIVIAYVSLIGAVSAGEKQTAQIFVYSQWESGQRGWLPISYDGVVIARIKDGGFFAIEALRGQHVLAAGEGVPITVEVGSTEPTFVRVGRHVKLKPSGRSEIPTLELRSRERGRLELVNLVYVSANKIYSPVVASRDPTLDWLPVLKNRKKWE